MMQNPQDIIFKLCINKFFEINMIKKNKIIDMAKDCILENLDEHYEDVTLENTEKSFVPEPKLNKDKLEQLYQKYKDCKNCELSKTRIKFVFGEGDAQSKLMFIGEGPGYEEDKTGRPFVGKAGELLTKIIEAMALSRQKVYIANIVKCHPVIDTENLEKRNNDRKPNEEEIKSCINILEQQIDIIKPKIICTLGLVATEALLKKGKSISSLRGREFEYNGITVIPTFHPAYLLRNPIDKKLVWEDMKKILSLL
jgi:uracil-DNA glycosylase